MKDPDPYPSRMQSDSPLFFIGEDCRGHWVAQDRSGLRGGVFKDRANAVKFALSENGNRSDGIVTMPGTHELHPGQQPIPVDYLVLIHNAPRGNFSR